MTKIGYFLASEEHGPNELVRQARLAEEAGFDGLWISDHYHPWIDEQGESPFVWAVIGALSQVTSLPVTTAVTCPIIRIHPAIIAQAAATAQVMLDGRFRLGVGTGEALNEVPATGMEWPGARERRRRLEEAIDLIRRLWTEERVDFEGEYYRTRRATIYERPEEPLPIYIAAAGPLAARLVGRKGDGFICTSGKRWDLYETLLENVRLGAEAAGRDFDRLPKMIEIKVSYDTDLELAEKACHWWAALALTPEEKHSTDDPLEMERLADAHPERARTRFIVTDDPDEVVERVAPYVELGFDELVFHGPGEQQERFIELFCRDVLPRLRARFG